MVKNACIGAAFGQTLRKRPLFARLWNGGIQNYCGMDSGRPFASTFSVTNAQIYLAS